MMEERLALVKDVIRDAIMDGIAEHINCHPESPEYRYWMMFQDLEDYLEEMMVW